MISLGKRARLVVFASLRARLIFLVLLAVLPPLVLILLTGLGQGSRASLNAQDEAIHLAEHAAEEQQTLVAGTRQLLTVLARLPLVRGRNVEACNTLLSEVLAEHNVYANLGVIEADGTLICSALPFTEPLDLDDRAYFQRVMESRDFVIGDYQIGRLTGVTSINFGYPVFDDGGGVQGVVFAALSLTNLNEQVFRRPLPPETTFQIIDRNGIILARSPDPELWVGQPLPEAPLAAAVLGQQTEGTVKVKGLDGVERLYAFTPLDGDEGTGAYVIIGFEPSAVYGEVNQLMTRTLAFLALLGAFTLAATWLFGERLILRRVETLMVATERLAAGDLTARTTLPYGLSELSRLARSFDEMAATLEGRTAEQDAAEMRIRRNAARAEALVRTATRLNAQLELEAVLDIVGEEAARALDFPVAIVYLYDGREEVLHQASVFGIPPEERQQLKAIPRPIYEEMLSQIGPAGVIPDLQNVPGLPNAGQHLSGDVRTAVLTVMQRNGKMIGALGVFSTGQIRTVDESELALLKGLSEQAALAINNARLFEELQRRLGQLQSLNTIDQAIVSRFSLPDALNVVLEQTLIRLEVDAAEVLLLDPQTEVLTYAAGLGFQGTAVQDTRLNVGEGYAGRAVQERRLLHVPDIGAAEGVAYSELLLEEGFVSYYCVPLATEQQVIGVLNVFHRSLRELEPDLLTFLKSLAAQAAIAVDNLRLFGKSEQLLQRIREQAQQVQQIVDTLPEGVLLIDRQRRLVMANPLAQEYLPLLAWEQAGGDVLTHLGGRPLDDLLRSRPAAMLWQEIELPEKERIFELAARPIGEESLEAGWVLVLADVTEERRRREHVQAQERLATVGQLAAGMAHDFNNIMSIITLYAGTLAKKPDHPRRAEYLETITRQAHHAARLIGQVLDFSRASVMQRMQLDLLPFVAEIVKLLQRTLPETIVINLVAEKEEYLVQVDPTRLQQALMNLAVNARDAMPEGGELRISLAHLELATGQPPPLPEMQPGRWVRLIVADTGTGIPAEALPHLFEPFFTTKERGQGTGLGLAQVYGIVKQHEGEIQVESHVAAGKSGRSGTTFIIYLPGAKGSAAEEPGTTAGPVLVARGEETVLLVEDNASTQAAVRDTLLTLGYRVLVANTGREALALFEQPNQRIDLVLSDMVMPEMGGEKLYLNLQANRPEVKLILMSGYPLDGEGRSLLEQNNVPRLQKPFTADELSRKVREVLDS